MVAITQWKYGKRWVYSTTYDEVVTSTVQNGLPIHEQFGAPGHITVVVGQMGEPRDVPGSGYDATYTHISVEECQLAQRYGWSVSSHSMTHNILPGGMAVPENARIEVVDSGRLLEERLGTPVTAFIAPGSDHCLPYAWPLAEEAGYLSMFGVRDQLNYPDTDLMQLCRPVVYHKLDDYNRGYDPYRLTYRARETGGWLVDYTHAVQDELVIPNRELTPTELGNRLDAVTRVGGDEVWLAVPEEVVDYLIMARETTIADEQQSPTAISYRLAAPDIPERIQWHTLTFVCAVPQDWPDVSVEVTRAGDSEPVTLERLDDTTIRYSHRVYDGQIVRIESKN
jgi:hypothetical protein